VTPRKRREGGHERLLNALLLHWAYGRLFIHLPPRSPR
jgi:hypothetical protein